VGDATDGTYVTHETNGRSHLRLAAEVSLWVALPARLISPMGPISPVRLRSSVLRYRRVFVALPAQVAELLLLERPVCQTALQQPKQETRNRVEEELVQVDEEGRGKLHRGPILPRYLQS
jgi:hypothetical protein